MIQDYVMAVCSLVFIVSLVPQVIHNHRDKSCNIVLTTSVPTAIALALVAGCQLSLSLYWSCVATAVTSGLWVALCVQRRRFLTRVVT